MKKYIKYTTTSFFILSLLFIGLLSNTSCSDEETTVDPYFRLYYAGLAGDSLIEDNYSCEFLSKDITKGFGITTNVGKWFVSADDGEEDWLQIFPDTGEDEGRFRVYATKNETWEQRTATIEIKDSKGNILRKIPVLQLSE